MKLQLDTTEKTIKLENNVKLSELLKVLDQLLPNKKWTEFTLETNTTIRNWTAPIIIKEYPKYHREWPWISCKESSYTDKPWKDKILCTNKSLEKFNIEY